MSPRLAIRTEFPIYTVKKGFPYSRLQPGCHLPNSPLPGIIKLLPASERLFSDIPAADGNMENLFTV
jgi:hypothetical protein